MNCYNCGKPISRKDKTETKEHIPSKVLFSGFGDEYKKNRITVPACHKCNNEYSKIDDVLRNAVGVSNSAISSQEMRTLTEKAVKSISKKRGWKDRIFMSKSGEVKGVSFNYKDFRKLVIKDFKGIFLHKYEYPISNDWKIEIIAEFEDDEHLSGAGEKIYQCLGQNASISHSGSEDIFKYRIGTLAEDDKGQLFNSDSPQNAMNIASSQIYHNKLNFIVIATKKKFLNLRFPLKMRRQRKKRKR